MKKSFFPIFFTDLCAGHPGRQNSRVTYQYKSLDGGAPTGGDAIWWQSGDAPAGGDCETRWCHMVTKWRCSCWRRLCNDGRALQSQTTTKVFMGVLLLVAMPYGDKEAMLLLAETVIRRQSSEVTDQYKSVDGGAPTGGDAIWWQSGDAPAGGD